MLSASNQTQRTQLFQELFRDYSGPCFGVRSVDGWSWSSSQNQHPQCTFVIHSSAAWHALLKDPTDRTLGEAFINQDLDVEGDLFAAFPAVRHLYQHAGSAGHHILRSLWRSSSDLAQWFRYGRQHSLDRDRTSISYHYDLPVDFYRTWLGPTLAYSCAYFRDPTEGLENAQANKLELICRKLALAPNRAFPRYRLRLGKSAAACVLPLRSGDLRHHAEPGTGSRHRQKNQPRPTGGQVPRRVAGLSHHPRAAYPF